MRYDSPVSILTSPIKSSTHRLISILTRRRALRKPDLVAGDVFAPAVNAGMMPKVEVLNIDDQSRTATVRLSNLPITPMLTFDQNNNWFPHISPDGKWIAYISFSNDIDPTDHPPFKTVSLKLMPVNGGFPKTIAYLYGGQGTINTPSWSPDSKMISFVSYSGRVK